MRRRRLGQLLRTFRTDRSETTREVADLLQRSDSWLARVERGEVGIRLAELRALLDHYGIADPDARSEMEDLAREGRQRGWWSKYRSALSTDYASYIGFEASATRLLVWQSLVVDGLLQTEDYARAVFRAAARTATVPDFDRPLSVRMQRQERLTASPPLEMDVVMDEAVLRRVIGGNLPVHAAQLDHLLDVARNMPTVAIQIIPFGDASHPGMLPAFTVLKFPADPTIVYVEGVTGDVYEEGEDAERLTLVHGDLRAAALSESASINLIERIRNEVAT